MKLKCRHILQVYKIAEFFLFFKKKKSYEKSFFSPDIVHQILWKLVRSWLIYKAKSHKEPVKSDFSNFKKIKKSGEGEESQSYGK